MKQTARSLTTKFIAYTALMTALTYVGTLLGFSGGQFYFNLGDTVILICAYLLGPLPAMISGGLGAFLGDLTVYPATMVYTLVIKAIEGLVAGLMFMLLKKACAKYLAKHMSDKMRDFMEAHPAPDLDDSSEGISSPAEGEASAAQDDANSIDAKPDEAISNEEEAAADVVPGSLQGAGEGDFGLANSSTSQTDELPQNDVYADENEAKTSTFAQIGSLKKRVAALTCAFSLPICLFCTAIMMVGYFISQAFIYGTYAAALVALPLDAVQATISSVAATVLIAVFAARSK